MMLVQLKTERLGVHWKGTKGVNWLLVLLEMLFSARAPNTTTESHTRQSQFDRYINDCMCM